MNYVEPIRDRKKIAQIKNLLRGQRSYQDLMLFVVGITEDEVSQWGISNDKLNEILTDPTILINWIKIDENN